MGVAFGIAIFAGLIGFAWYASRLAERNGEDSLGDVGLAIVEFGRAFPNEAIRSLHVTADGKAVFVRLHDNRAGFMRNMRNHYACQLLEPGHVHVTPLEKAHGFHVKFDDSPQHNGNYLFATAAEASDVSLWLLGNFLSAKHQPLPHHHEPHTQS
ncbi:hypothetical protein [Allorhizobium sonneratiae]|uniref:hypothetical protein n=1 Tax=Allorhizobium sonneratiae TaxID=2934936 RepID=UPI003B84971C